MTKDGAPQIVNGDRRAWEQWAKEHNYPNCEKCGGPLPKGRWKKGFHVSCPGAKSVFDSQSFWAKTPGTNPVYFYDRGAGNR